MSVFPVPPVSETITAHRVEPVRDPTEPVKPPSSPSSASSEAAKSHVEARNQEIPVQREPQSRESIASSNTEIRTESHSNEPVATAEPVIVKTKPKVKQTVSNFYSCNRLH
jgi:hypothetical protein